MITGKLVTTFSGKKAPELLLLEVLPYMVGYINILEKQGTSASQVYYGRPGDIPFSYMVYRVAQMESSEDCLIVIVEALGENNE